MPVVPSVGWRREASGPQRCLGSVGGVQLVEDARHVVLRGLQGDAEGAGDLLVTRPVAEQVKTSRSRAYLAGLATGMIQHDDRGKSRR